MIEYLTRKLPIYIRKSGGLWVLTDWELKARQQSMQIYDNVRSFSKERAKRYAEQQIKYDPELYSCIIPEEDKD